jgi:transcription initiation factor TFIIIB Brf1 subunit/transcription initiation factor TFIIB
MSGESNTTCYRCDGTGQIPPRTLGSNLSEICPICNGTGSIPANTQTNNIVRLSIPGNVCTICGTIMGESLVCPGCSWVDPLTKRNKPRSAKSTELDHLADEIQKAYKIHRRLATTENLLARDEVKRLLEAWRDIAIQSAEEETKLILSVLTDDELMDVQVRLSQLKGDSK